MPPDVLVLSELFYPQGGGAETATYLYLKSMLGAGLRVTLLTNKDLVNRNSKYLKVFHFPLKASECTKIGLLFAYPFITKTVIRLAKSHNVVYIPGKLLTLAPILKRANPSLKVIVHLHDYQLVCPHASLFNSIDKKKCNWIWDYKICRKCIFNYESIVGGGSLRPFLGVLGAEVWKRVYDASKISEIIECTDTFITVSNAQKKIIYDCLTKSADIFLKKNITIPNPLSSEIRHVDPSFNDNIYLSCFSGDRYLKGFDNAIRLTSKINDSHQRNFSLMILGHLKKEKQFFFKKNIDLLGYIPPKTLFKYYAKTWIVLFMSLLNEPSPYTIAEAQLMGRPVLATAVGGASENIVEHGLTGEIVGTTVESFIEPILRYTEMLSRKPKLLTRKISTKASIFFKARTKRGFKDFTSLLKR